jgi:predicted  nucleic acid-binding Zn-ribbon protein
LPTQIEVLANLQVVDQSLHAKTSEVSEGERRVTELEEALRTQTAATTGAREELSALSARQSDLEARLSAAEAKMKDRRMRITRIRNDKELGLAKREVDLLKEETATLETELVGVMELVEAATTKVQGLEQELTRLTEEHTAGTGALRDTIARLGAEIERERAERTQIIEREDGELRRKYEMLFSRRGGLAVVEVRGGTCQGCRMRVPPQLFNDIQRNEKVILCPSCQRMLYWRNEGEEANG